MHNFLQYGFKNTFAVIFMIVSIFIDEKQSSKYSL